MPSHLPRDAVLLDVSPLAFTFFYIKVTMQIEWFDTKVTMRIELFYIKVTNRKYASTRTTCCSPVGSSLRSHTPSPQGDTGIRPRKCTVRPPGPSLPGSGSRPHTSAGCRLGTGQSRSEGKGARIRCTACRSCRTGLRERCWIYL